MGVISDRGDDQVNFPLLDWVAFDRVFRSARAPMVIFLATIDCRICAPAERELMVLMPRWRGFADFFRVDADDQREIAKFLDIKAVPAVIVVVPGSQPAVILGFNDAETLHRRLRAIISSGAEQDAKG